MVIHYRIHRIHKYEQFPFKRSIKWLNSLILKKSTTLVTVLNKDSLEYEVSVLFFLYDPLLQLLHKIFKSQNEITFNQRRYLYVGRQDKWRAARSARVAL